MITKHIFGTPFDTEAVVLGLEAAAGSPSGFETVCGEQLVLTRPLSDEEE